MKPIRFVWWHWWSEIPVPLSPSVLEQLAPIVAAAPSDLECVVDLQTGRADESLGFQELDDCWAVSYYHEPSDDLGQSGHQGIYWSGSTIDEVGCTVIREAAALILHRHQTPALFPEEIA